MLVRTTSLALLLLFTAVSCADSSSGRNTPSSGGENNTPPVTKGDGTAFTPGKTEAPEVPQPGSKGTGGNGGSGPGNPGAPVPEPATILLVGTGLAGLAIYHRRKRRSTIA